MGIHVFIGGTYKDIKDFRQAAHDSLRRRATVETMKDFPTAEKAPPELCRQRLERCTHYLLIIGLRYGWIPPGYDLSITELEYGWAKTLGLPMKIYIYEPCNNCEITDHENKDKLEQFKARVRLEHSPRNFKDLADLKYLLELTLRDWFEEIGPDFQQGQRHVEVGIVSGNITNSLIVAGNNNPFIFFSDSSSDFRDQLGQVFEERLEDLVRLRLSGNYSGAWKELKKILEDLVVRRIPNQVAARYYLLAARWTIADFPGSPDADRYYKHAISLDKELDTRSYRAKQLMMNGHYDQAMALLQPLDKENILNTALQLLLEKGKGEEAENLLAKATAKPTHATRQILAMCHLQAKKFLKAEAEIQKAISELPNAPVYHLTAGFIAYWRGISEDLQDDVLSLGPTFFKLGLFAPSVEQVRFLEEALVYFEEAKRYANFYNEPVLMRSIREAWFLTACLLANKKKEADLEALSILEEYPESSISLIYVVENSLSLNDITISSVRNLIRSGQADLNHIVALVRLHISRKETKEVISLIEQYESMFTGQGGRLERLHLMMEAYVIDEKWPEIESLIDAANGVEVHSKSRLKCWLYERTGRKPELMKLMESLANNPGLRIDLRNLCLLYYRENLWDKIIPIARQWLNKYADAEAAIFLAKAQLMSDSSKDCLKTLQENGKLFTEERFSIRASQIKMQGLWELGRTDKALEIGNDLWNVSPSQNLLLNRAQLYICEGDEVGAVTVIREGLKQGFKSPALFFMIANLITAEYPDDAFEYAKQALDYYQNDPQVYCSTIFMGFRTGHDIEASKLLAGFHLKFPNSKLLQSKPSTELVPMMSQYAKASEYRWQLYRNGQVPLHIILDVENISMGADFYWRWHHNREADYSQRVAFPLVYGGRKEFDPALFGNLVFMDYSACLVAHALQLFDVLGKAFSHIVVPRSLFAAILHEIKDLKAIQPSRFECRKKLLSAIKHLNLKEISPPQIPFEDPSNLLYSDRQQWVAAEEYGALIVEDHFATELLEGREIPDEIKKKQIYTYEIVKVMIQKGEITKELVNFNFDSREVRNDIVNKLMENPPPLLVDSVFLEKMLEADLLNIITDNFELLVFENTFSDLEEEQQRLEKRIEVAKWLDKLLAELREIKHKGKLRFGPVGKDKDFEGELTLLLKEALAFGNLKSDPVWCDDRNINSYLKTGTAPVVSVFDILAYLSEKKYISIDYYREKIHSLYRSKVQFKVPPSIHLTMAIGQAKIDPDTNLLRENNFLKIIRQSIAAALSEHSIINKVVLPHVQGPEIAGYLSNLWMTMENVLTTIWTDPDREDKWRISASNWLLWHCSDSLGDCLHFIEKPVPIENLIGLKHSSFIGLGFRLLLKNNDGEQLCNKYFSWLFSWLEDYWRFNPNVKLEAIETFASLLSNLALDFINNREKFTIFLLYFERFKDLLSEEIKNCILDHPKIQKILEPIKKVLIVEGINEISEEIWIEWVQRSVIRGNGIKGAESHSGFDIAVTFVGDSLAKQVIRLEWNDQQGNLHERNILEPFAQLYRSDKACRQNWLKLANSFFSNDEGILNNVLQSKEIEHNKFQGLADILEQSSRFFFERLSLLISNSDHLPSQKELFPTNPFLFVDELSQIPSLEDIDGEEWLKYYCDKIALKGIDEALSLLATLPVCGHWSFSTMLGKLVVNGYIDIKDAQEYCFNLLENTCNPIKEQNIIIFLLQFSTVLEQDRIALIDKKFIDLLGGEEGLMSYSDYYRLYISLLICAWRFMLINDNYRDFSEEQKILWSYIYADRVLSMFQEVIANEIFPYPMGVVANTFEKLSQSLLSKMHPFRERNSYPLEVAHPEAASVWRTVFGGTLAVLQDCENLLQIIKSSLLPILEKIEARCASGELIGEGRGEEQLLIFTTTLNRFQSNFDKNNWVRMQKIISKFREKSLVAFDPDEYALNLLKKCIQENDFNDTVLLYLWMLSKHPVPDYLLDYIKEILERYRLSNDISDEKILLHGRITSQLIKSLPSIDKTYFLDIYKNDLIQILQNNPNRWDLFIEVLAILCSSNDYVEASQSFLTVLEEAFLKRTGLKVPPKLFYSLCNSAWWLPVSLLNRINKLRRELNAY